MKMISILDPVEGSVRIYSRCVRLYPKNFRQAFQGELVQVFQARTQALYQRQRMRGLILFWLHTIIDTLRTVVVEHFEEVFGMKKNSPKLIAAAFAAFGGLLVVFLMFANWSTMPYPFPSKASLLARLWASVPLDSDFTIESLDAFPREDGNIWDGGVGINANWEPEFIDQRAFLTLTRSEVDELKPYVSESQFTDLSYFEAPDPNRWLSLYFVGRYSYTGSPWQTIFAYPISAWQVHASPLAIGLPALWLASLVGIVLWKKATKLGSFGLIFGGTGCVIMIASLFLAVLMSRIAAAWSFFTGGMIMLGLGLVIFGLDALRNNLLPRWNGLPAVMGLTIIAFEAANRLYLPGPDGFEVWTRVQGLALAAISIAWLALGWVISSEKQGELLPA